MKQGPILWTFLGNFIFCHPALMQVQIQLVLANACLITEPLVWPH